MATDVVSPPERALSEPAERAMSGSIVAGQVAGLAMGVVVVAVYATVLGRFFLYPLQVMGALFLGDGALQHATAGNVLLGLIAHQLGPSLFWSVVFGAIVSAAGVRPTLNQALLLGLAIGLAAEIFDVYIVMPFFQHAVNGHNIWMEQVPRFWDWAAHAVYGLTLGGVYAALRRPVVAERRSSRGNLDVPI